MHGRTLCENRESPSFPVADGCRGTRREVYGRNPAMNERGKSDRSDVPTKPPNKEGRGGERRHGNPYTGTKVETPDTAKGEPTGERASTEPTAEAVEGRDLANGNPEPQNARRTQGRESVSKAWQRVRAAARRDKGARFTSLFHLVYDVQTLRWSFQDLKRNAAPGVDGVTWKQYDENLEGNLADLSSRLRRGAYRAKPVRRAYIPKADGRQRPLGVTALEDKLVQRAAVWVLSAIYEVDFYGFSYGFRPERGCHQALDALSVGIQRKNVSWILDADIRGFFDAIDRGWLVKFIEHRIADKRVVRLIQKWLNAGVLEDGQLQHPEGGTPQGGSISPLLANIYLHYAFDQWAHQWRERQAQGDVIIVRYADDFVVGFAKKAEAERFLGELRERLARFSLELHADKTRLIEFGRFAATGREKRGLGKPETFNFLGFTHLCAKTRKGWFQVRRLTMQKRMRAKLQEVKAELARRCHDPVPEVGKWLGSVVRGHLQYFGVPLNYQALAAFRREVCDHWRRALLRRSQKARMSVGRMGRLAERWLPPVRILHPYPSNRLRVTAPRRANTRGKSPVR